MHRCCRGSGRGGTRQQLAIFTTSPQSNAFHLIIHQNQGLDRVFFRVLHVLNINAQYIFHIGSKCQKKRNEKKRKQRSCNTIIWDSFLKNKFRSLQLEVKSTESLEPEVYSVRRGEEKSIAAFSEGGTRNEGERGTRFSSDKRTSGGRVEERNERGRRRRRGGTMCMKDVAAT